MTNQFPKLLSPLQVGPITVRNRVLVTGHVPGVEDQGFAGEAFVAYHRARARGGAGLQMSGASAIHPTGRLGGGRGLNLMRDDAEKGLSDLARSIHAEGGRFLVQLAHSAATTDYTATGQTLVAPSPVASGILRQVPHELTEREISELIEAYVTAARRVAASGLDGVEILTAFGFLPGAFLSPLTNKRTDDYGGSLENRARFGLEVAAAIRKAVGRDVVVGMRIPGTENIMGGLTGVEAAQAAQLFAASGDLDYLNVTIGTNYDPVMRWEHWPASPSPHGAFVPYAATIKQNVDIPVFVTGRVTSPALAESIVADGKADMVGMTRAHLADPDIVRKITTNRIDAIRPCVGANICIARGGVGKPVRCFYNTEAGREHAWGELEPASDPKTIVVIGAGPAGLEAARTAALRGHKVTILEAGPGVGGQLATWAKSPFAREFRKVLDWYEGQLEELQVRVSTNHKVSHDDLANLKADAIILATGSSPVPTELPSNHDISILSPQDVLNASDMPQGHTVILDEGAGRDGLAVAEVLAEAGRTVTIVSTEDQIAARVDGTVRTQLYRFLLDKGVLFIPMSRVASMEANTVAVENIYTGQQQIIDNVTTLVDWSGNRVTADLLEAAKVLDLPVLPAGDMLAPRTVQIATSEGAIAGRHV